MLFFLFTLLIPLPIIFEEIECIQVDANILLNPESYVGQSNLLPLSYHHGERSSLLVKVNSYSAAMFSVSLHLLKDDTFFSTISGL